MKDKIQLPLFSLQDEFLTCLPERLHLLESLLAAVERGESASIDSLQREVQSLVGAASAHSLSGISEAARKLERIAAELPKDRAAGIARELAVRQAFARLGEEVANSNRNLVSPPTVRMKSLASRVLVVDDNAKQAVWLRSALEGAGYQVEVFDSLAALHAVCGTGECPAAIIIDMALSASNLADVETIAKLKADSMFSLPVIFLAGQQDMESRLAAYRAGATRYLTKPVSSEKLIGAITDAAGFKPAEPYRVVLVDDNTNQLELHALILRQAGLEVRETRDPFQVAGILDHFKAEVLLFDMYMPKCSGPELAAILHDDDRYAQIPVVYLSVEADISRQLHALDRGGDYFLGKPVEPRHLVAATILHARRYRSFYEQSASLRTSLYERERQLQALDTHAIVSVADPAGNILYVNDKFSEISGYQREELVGRNHRIIKSGEHPSGFFDEMWLTISSGKIWHGEICNRRKDGSYYWVETSIVPFMDANGLPYQYIGIRTDITHIIEAEQRLRRSQIYANIGTWDWNIQTGALFWSERIGPLFGYPEGKLETTYDNFLAAVHPDDRVKVIKAISNCIERGHDYDIEHRCVWPDGTVRWLLERGDVVRDQIGKPLHMLGVVQDIHERKLSEAALLEARDEADRANRAKSDFLSSMSHELRTPMNAILGFGQLLEYDDQLSAEHKDSVQEILKAGEHLLELINDVLDLSKVESGYIDLSLEPVELCPLVEECIHLVGALAEKRGIRVTHSSLKGAAVRADHTRLRQVLLNLLSNAIKYNREGGSVKIELKLEADNRLRILVSDSGVGISARHMKDLFQPFNRLGAEGGSIEGTGIGLTITRRIVEMMGGTVDAMSEVGVGSTFWIELPLESAGESVHALKHALKNEAQTLPGDVTGKCTVLYIEDNPANIKLVAQLLGRRKHIHLLTAHTPELGLELATERFPELILLDINMPGMDGYEVLKVLKAEEKLKSIPVVAVTANAMSRDIERGMAAGFVDYLTKPLNVVRFFETLDRCLEGITNRDK